MDQKSILNSAKCFKEFGSEIYKLNLYPKNCGGFQYSIELLRFLNFTHLSSVSGDLLGAILMWSTIAIFLILIFMIKNKGKFDNLVSILALTSPGIWLLFERGNYDELVFVLIFAASMLLMSKYQELGVVLIVATVLMKFYTLPLYFISILIVKKKKSKRLALAISIPLTIYVYTLIKQVVLFPSTWYVSFGVKSLGLYLEMAIQEKISTSFHLNALIGIIIGLLFMFVILRKLTSLQVAPSLQSRETNSANLAFGIYFGTLIVFISCFFAGMNFDYRLIYPATLISISPLVLCNNRFRSIIVISGLASVLLSTYSFGTHGIPALMIQFVGDIFLYIFVCAQLKFISCQLSPIIKIYSREMRENGAQGVITLIRANL